MTWQNAVRITGTLMEPFHYERSANCVKLYRSTLERIRPSGRRDLFPVFATREVAEMWRKRNVLVSGRICSTDPWMTGQHPLELSYILATSIENPNGQDVNEAVFCGRACRDTTCHGAPLALLSVPRKDGSADRVRAVGLRGERYAEAARALKAIRKGDTARIFDDMGMHEAEKRDRNRVMFRTELEILARSVEVRTNGE